MLFTEEIIVYYDEKVDVLEISEIIKELGGECLLICGDIKDSSCAGYCVDKTIECFEKLVKRYPATKTAVKPNTLANYKFVRNVLKGETFNDKKISQIKTSDAKLFLIKLQQDGRRYSTIKTVRGVLCPAFQMAVDDDVLLKNPFGFEMATVVVNDSVTREAITKDQMRKFLEFVHDDNVYYRYYEVVYILFHTGMRISEFCGLTLRDIDLKNKWCFLK